MTQEKRKKTQAELDEELKVKAPKTFELRQKIKEGAAPTLEARRRVAGGYHFGETTGSKLGIDPNRRYTPPTELEKGGAEDWLDKVRSYEAYFGSQAPYSGKKPPPYRIRGLQLGLSAEEYQQTIEGIQEKLNLSEEEFERQTLEAGGELAFERLPESETYGKDIRKRDRLTPGEKYLIGRSDEGPEGLPVIPPSDNILISPFTGAETTAMIQKKKELEWFNETYPGIANYGGERAASSGGQNWWDLYGKYGQRVRTVDF